MEIQVGSTVAKKARRPRTTRKGDEFLAGRSDAALRITKLLVGWARWAAWDRFAVAVAGEFEGELLWQVSCK
jgi:hypothetical protein